MKKLLTTLTICMLFGCSILANNIAKKAKDLTLETFNTLAPVTMIIEKDVFGDDALYPLLTAGSEKAGVVLNGTFYFKSGKVLYAIPERIVTERAPLNPTVMSQSAGRMQSRYDDPVVRGLISKRSSAYRSAWGLIAGSGFLALIGTFVIPSSYEAGIALCAASGAVGVASTVQFCRSAVYQQRINDHLLLSGGINGVSITF